MENTIENKARFFSQYSDAEYIYTGSWGTFKNNVNDFYNLIDNLPKSKLLLKPLSQITDEDALDAGLKSTGRNSSISDDYWAKDDIRAWIRGGMRPVMSIEQSTSTIDFLRSKGYALPWMGLSVEKQIEYGWVKIS